VVFFSVAASVGDALNVALPSWASDVTVVGLIILFGVGLARNWFYTGGQVNHVVTQYEKVAALWEKVADERQKTIELMAAGYEPVLRSNEAILRAVEQLQAQQEYMRRSHGHERGQGHSYDEP